MKLKNKSHLNLNKNIYIIGEVAQSHDGSLGYAHSLIDLIADSGANAVKFQTHIANSESTYDESWRINFSYEDKYRYDYWKRMEFTKEEWFGLALHAKKRKLDFLSSPFSIEAVELLEKLKVKLWKVASGELYNSMLLEKLWQTRKPILYSSGFSTYADLKKIAQITKLKKIPYGIFQCTTAYPTPPELWNLSSIKKLQKDFDCPIGLSDHSGEIYASLAAVTLGAKIIEVHVNFDKQAFGPDSTSSINGKELSNLVKGANDIYKAMNSVDTKDHFAKKNKSLRIKFGRSLTLKKPLPGGYKIKLKDLTLKKPGNGILYKEINKVIGKILKKDKTEKRLLKWKDFK